ncbi:putative transcription regulator Rcd1-like family [Medicago truncatula]|nr:putative transcription regulator Rcd1-like family [Medicago truncatula]
MQNGNELTKIVATFIILKIILDDDGLARVCATTENFFGVCRVLNMMLEDLENPPSPRLLRLLISCYSRLSQNYRARVALTTYLPNRLKDANLINFFRDDPKTMRLVLELHENVGVN